MASLIQIKNLIKEYHRGTETIRAVNDVCLEVEKGGLIALVGPSGAGKTSFLNLLGCLDTPTSGTVSINEVEVTDLREPELTHFRQEHIGFVFQQFFLLPSLTALENVQLPTVFGRGQSTGTRNHALQLLERVGLKGRTDHLPQQLSGGEMQRVAIARSLIANPSVLLADEPTGNLDSRNAEMVMDLLGDLNRDGVTIIFVTHNRELARKAKQQLLIRDGCLQDGG